MRWTAQRSFVLAGSLAAASLLAGDGELDPGFWSDGRVYFAGSGNYLVEATVEAPDGRVVVVGTYDGPGASAPQWFWRAIGDESSATSSTCFFPPPGGASEGRAHAAAFDWADRLVVAGSAEYGTVRLAAARFDFPDCVLDDSFDGDGYWTLDVPGGLEELSAVALHANSGRIALGGTWNDATQSDMVVALLSNAGTLVNTFSGNGWLRFDPYPAAGFDYELAGIAFTDSAHVIAAGTTFYGAARTEGEWTVAQFTPTGALDSSFSGNGHTQIAFNLGGTDNDLLYGLARDRRSGKLLLTGSVEVDDFEYGQGVARLLAHGSLDSSFSEDGKADLALADLIAPRDVAVDDLGRVLVAGIWVSSQDLDFYAVRYTSDGELDSTFGFGGLSVIPFDPRAGGFDDEQGRALAIQSGRVVVAGDVSVAAGENRVGLARLEVSLVFADGFESGTLDLWSSDSGPQ